MRVLLSPAYVAKLASVSLLHALILRSETIRGVTLRVTFEKRCEMRHSIIELLIKFESPLPISVSSFMRNGGPCRSFRIDTS
jgi:hypothetical protein